MCARRQRRAVPSRGDPSVPTNPIAAAAARWVGIAALSFFTVREAADPRVVFSETLAVSSLLSSSGLQPPLHCTTAARRPRRLPRSTGRCNLLPNSEPPLLPPLLLSDAASRSWVLLLLQVQSAPKGKDSSVQFAAFWLSASLPTERKGCARCFLLQACPSALSDALFSPRVGGTARRVRVIVSVLSKVCLLRCLLRQ